MRVLPLVLGWFALAAAPCALSAQDSSVEHSMRDQVVSERRFPGLVRESTYLTVRDGTRLAVDLIRPVEQGRSVDQPLPLIWTHHRYHRADLSEGRVQSMADDPMTRELVLRGYVVAAVDVRGAGASFGSSPGVLSSLETQDAFDILEWFAAQPWCDGNIGMFGGSYLGATQYLAASTQSKHLKAIIPAVAPTEMYAFVRAGGIARDDFVESWNRLTRRLDTETPAAPVDSDVDRSLLDAALREHAHNRDTVDLYEPALFRDHVDEQLDARVYQESSALHHVEAIQDSGVAIYHLAGWLDCFTADQLTLFANLDNPQRIAIGPWFHQQRHEFDNMGEHLRWYDHFLKGIDNGVMDEPPIHYYVMGAPAGKRWRTAFEWPLPQEQPTRFFFHPGTQPHSGSLLPEPPEEARIVERAVDYSTTSGSGNRWKNGYGGPIGYADMAGNDQKGFCYTTPPLKSDLQLTGHPVVTLWIESTADDGDFFVYLEEVELDGRSQYVTEGCLRASNRALHDSPWENFGLPWHRSFAADVEPLPEEPVELLLDLQPTSNWFDSGHRIRVNVTCADQGNQRTPRLDPAPTITMHHGPLRASSILLPVIPAAEVPPSESGDR